MNEKRFIIDVEEEFQENAVFFGDEFLCFEDDSESLVSKLNEQQATIDEQKIIIEERDAANERLNRFLIEIGLEKEYIKWEFKKRCVE